MTLEAQILDTQRYGRREAFARQLLHDLEDTFRIRGEEGEEYIEWTDASSRLVHPLVEALFILEEIIWASDGCVGHRDCAHTLEPWQRARALLAGKWKADEERMLGR